MLSLSGCVSVRFLLSIWQENHLNFLHIERECRKGGGILEEAGETFLAVWRISPHMASIHCAYNSDCYRTGNLVIPCKRVFIAAREQAGLS